MTKIKMCGLTRPEDIHAVNILKPDYIGFVYAAQSRRRVTMQQSSELKKELDSSIQSVGVFVNDDIHTIISIAEAGIIDLIQLHGSEDENYLAELRRHTALPLIQAFVINTAEDVQQAVSSTADLILLDGGKGNGLPFDWNLLSGIQRPYFLAGGLHPRNVANAVKKLHPFAADVSSGIETEGKKDYDKMEAFIHAVRKEESI